MTNFGKIDHSDVYIAKFKKDHPNINFGLGVFAFKEFYHLLGCKKTLLFFHWFLVYGGKLVIEKSSRHPNQTRLFYYRKNDEKGYKIPRTYTNILMREGLIYFDEDKQQFFLKEDDERIIALRGRLAKGMAERGIPAP